MRIIKFEDLDALSEYGALLIAETVNDNNKCTLGLATGSSPIGIYEKLTKLYKEGKVDFSGVNTFNLDEYVGLKENDPQSYRFFMDHHLFDSININKKNTFIPDGSADDLESVCSEYEKLIEEHGGIDLQLLGIGHNGHIGFNEPGTEFSKKTKVVELSSSTRQANKRFFSSIDDVPTYAITMGVETIMKAKKIVMVAYGADKASIIHDAFFKEVTPLIPASILQLHPDFTLLADKEALNNI